MQIKHSIFRRGKKGGDDARSYKKAWTLRFTFTDQSGSTKRKTYQFASRNDAVDSRAKLEAELKKTQGQSVIGDKMTFRDLAKYSKATFYRPAEIVEGRKVAGIKSYKQTYSAIDSLIGYFQDRKLASLTRNDLSAYKSWRLKQGDRRGTRGKLKATERRSVKVSTVNRDLATFKHLVKFAHAEGWIGRDITLGSTAIDVDAEIARTRTLTDAEEMRLLAASGGRRTVEYKREGKAVTATIEADNPHLKALILLGLDSGMRRGEILKLEWNDIDFERGIIKILGTHTKTQKSRFVPMTSRAKAELVTLPNFGASGRVFPFNDFKRSWATALKIAGIDGLNFHDLRRTFVTRLQTGGVSIGIAAELAGHSRLETTQKHYTSTDNAAVVLDAAQRINAANESRLNLWPDTIE
ncbi:MAG TPA: site-specific integrase [Pyrinomonadaceae bacterium]